jgi:hypothetical protein
LPKKIPVLIGKGEFTSFFDDEFLALYSRSNKITNRNMQKEG